MVQVLEQSPGFGALFGQGLGQGLNQSMDDVSKLLANRKREKKENEALQKLFGQDFSGLSPDIKQEIIGKLFSQKNEQMDDSEKIKELTGLDLSGIGPQNRNIFLKNYFEEKEKERSSDLKKEEALIPFQGALETLEKMKRIKKRGNIGLLNAYTQPWNPEHRRDKAEYERLGKSLIQYSTNIPIRNRTEFEVLAEDLYHANKTEAELEGILDAMEDIIKSSMKQYQKPVQGQSNILPEKRLEERPPLSSFRK